MSAQAPSGLPPGAQLPSEWGSLMAQVERLAPQRILELGVYQGGTLARLALCFPEATVVGIDPEPHGIERDGTLHGCPVVRGRSQEWWARTKALELLGGLPDFVHVDGGHRLLDVWADLAWVLAELKPGLVALHDVTNRRHPELDVWVAWEALKERTPPGWLTQEIRHAEDEYGFGLLWRVA